MTDLTVPLSFWVSNRTCQFYIIRNDYLDLKVKMSPLYHYIKLQDLAKRWMVTQKKLSKIRKNNLFNNYYFFKNNYL